MEIFFFQVCGNPELVAMTPGHQKKPVISELSLNSCMVHLHGKRRLLRILENESRSYQYR